jgi:hypothetical protein
VGAVGQTILTTAGMLSDWIKGDFDHVAAGREGAGCEHDGMIGQGGLYPV